MVVHKNRINFEFPDETMDRLNRLIEMSDSGSRTEVVKKALKVFEILLTTKVEEDRIILKLKDGNQRELLI